MESKYHKPLVSTLVFVAYPGTPIIKDTINEKKCEMIIRYIQRLKIVSPNEYNNNMNFDKHGIHVFCPGKFRIFINKNLILHKAGNISSLYDDPKRKMEKRILKDTSKRNYKLMVDFYEMSKLI